MYKCIKILFLWLFFPYMAYADGIITPLSIAIVSSENSEMQISTTKGTLYEDNVLICFTEKETCAVYRGSDFSSIMPNDSVEDVATGKKIYTYSLRTPESHKFKTGISVAFIFHGDSIEVRDVNFNAHRGLVIKNNKIKEVVSYCTSSEGVHVMSKYGGVHIYYSLGYAVETNCSEEVYK